MNFAKYKTSLKNKFSILVALAIMLVAGAFGMYFDSSLRSHSLKSANTRILHGYQRLAYNLENIESSLKEGIAFIRSDEQIQASIQLINNYQDKNNYNTYLIDEEKKSIANQLLNKVKFSFNNDIDLYDKNDELVAFVYKHKEGYELGYITYANSQSRLMKRSEQQGEYSKGEFQLNKNISVLHDDINQVNETSLIAYKYFGDDIVIKSHQSIVDKESNKVIGHIEMSRILNDAYFSELSQTLDLNLKYSFDPSLEGVAKVMNNNLGSQHFNIIQDEDNYSVILKQASLDGPIYYLAKLGKHDFNLLLTQSRKQFFILLTLVTFSVLLLMRYIINRNLAQPLSVLMNQINKIERQDYTESKPIQSGDELESASKNINRLAYTIKERESSLKKSMQEQEQLSSQLEDSGAHLQTLIKTLPDLVWLKDVDGVYLSCNEKFEELFGSAEDDIIGKTDYDFVDHDLATAFREHDKIAMAAENPTINEEEVTYVSDGHVEYLETIKTPMFSPEGKLIGVLGVGRDITERKKIEEKLILSSSRLNKLASRLPGMVYQFEMNDKGNMSFPYMSEAVEEIYHVTAKEVLEDVNRFFSLTHPDDIENLKSSILESAHTFTPWKLEYRIVDEDGCVRWLYGNSIPERKQEGGLMWYGYITDITKSKEMDETLRRTQKMNALGKLTGGIAHDYNNMLSVVLGYSDLLLDSLHEHPEFKKYVNEIIHAGNRGAKLTSKLLSFSRQKSSDAITLNINRVLLDEQHMLEKTLTARVQLEFKLEQNLWATYLDESEFEDTVLNLSINAMHAIDNNGKLIIETNNIHLEGVDAEKLKLDEGDYVRLIVTDTGCGLNDIEKEKIFDPFYSTKGDKGTGLGLTQVYGFINRSNGAVKVESQINQGTSFSLYFPRDFSQVVKVDDIEIRDNVYLKGKERILVVDDEPALLTLACKILEKQGYQVFKAEHAKSALEILVNESIDLLVSDVIMPEIDGYELATIVQDKYPNIKIQLVSGFTGLENDDYEDNVLFKTLLHKPYTAKSLLKSIQDLLM
ncbi:MAG: PAS domain S-box protein [Woeseiaceae bacterium]